METSSVITIIILISKTVISRSTLHLPNYTYISHSIYFIEYLDEGWIIWRFNVFSLSISVISGRGEDDCERLFAKIEMRLGVGENLASIWTRTTDLMTQIIRQHRQFSRSLKT